MLILYEILLSIYAILCLPLLLIKGKWHAGFKERFGFLSEELKGRLKHDKNIWVHAVSVGEVVAINELIRQLKKRLPGYRVVLSTSTKTGYELAVNKFKDEAMVIWAPLDFSLSVNSFADAINPKAYVVAETELWPNLFSLLSKRQVPIILVNGRISDKSYGSYKAVRWFMRRFLHMVDVFCMQSDEDMDRIIHLGAPRKKVHNVGNVKFDDLPADISLRKEDLGFDPVDDLWIAGSTHPGEEEIILDVYHRIKSGYPHVRLMIAPRHVERTAEVMRLVESRRFSPQRLSQAKDSPKNSETVVIVDSIGQLRSLYSMAAVVLVGKSFTVPGGHNIIEPAFFAKPVIVGPFMQNFRDITTVFKKDNAIIQLEDPSELEAALRELLDSPAKRKELGQRARSVINKYTGATMRSVDFIVITLHKGL
jgi:3-deoxy-D-manno-octulosonic-acid transferase